MRRRTARSPDGPARISARPEVGKTSCISSLSVVVLPAPFGPEKPEDLARLDRKRQPIERAIRTGSPEADRVVLRELVDVNRGGHTKFEGRLAHRAALL